jgi:hypothetical protein
MDARQKHSGMTRSFAITSPDLKKVPKNIAAA